MKVTIESGKWAWITTKRGRVLRAWGEYVDHYIILPKVTRVSITAYGKNVCVQFGRALTLSMPTSEWALMDQAVLELVYGGISDE